MVFRINEWFVGVLEGDDIGAYISVRIYSSKFSWKEIIVLIS